MKQLAGAMFVRNGIKYDYCFREAIHSLLNFCDEVFVVDAGSTDGTLQALHSIRHPNLKVISLSEKEWNKQSGRGKEKLCYFSNLAIDYAELNDYEYVFYCQADEVVHENSYWRIRELCNFGKDGYVISRINLWGSPYYQLDVENERLPCSRFVLRLSKSQFRTDGDAESIAVPYDNVYMAESVKMYHMGFVRDRKVMIHKTIEMQENVFELGTHDEKIDISGKYFKPELWFDLKKDIKLIDEPLPATVKEWAKKRVYKLN